MHDHARIAFGSRVAMVVLGLTCAAGCLALAAVAIFAITRELDSPWVAAAMALFFAFLARVSLGIAWRGMRGTKAAWAARASSAFYESPAAFVGALALVMLFAAGDSSAPMIRWPLLIGGVLFALEAIKLGFEARRLSRAAAPNAGRNLMQSLLTFSRPRAYAVTTAECLAAARAAELNSFEVLLAICVTLDHGELAVADELFTIADGYRLGPHLLDVELQRTLHLALNRADLAGARAAFERASPLPGPTGYARLAEAAVRLVEGDDAGAAQALEAWQRFTDTQGPTRWLQAGNEWAEDALARRLEASGTIAVVSRRDA